MDEPIKISIDNSTNKTNVDGMYKDIAAKEVDIQPANYLTLSVPVAGPAVIDKWFTLIGVALIVVSAIRLSWYYIKQIRH